VRLFLVVFFVIYGLLHLYAFFKAKAALRFSTGTGLAVLLFMTVMTLSPFFVYQLEKAGLESFARGMSYTGFLWMGALFIFVSAAFFLDIYRLMVWIAGSIISSKLPMHIPSARSCFILALFAAAAVNVYGHYEASDIRTEVITVKSSKIPKRAGGFKIVQISDVHLGLIVREERLKGIVEAVKNADPDLLVSTGDLVDGQINKLHGLAELLQQIQPEYGKYAVTGNHEYYAGLEQAVSFTEKAGFVLLRGSAVDVGGIINLVGIDDSTGRRFGLYTAIDENDLLSGVDRAGFTILLKHRPRVVQGASGLFDLQLSGHTHKGQVFPFSLITRFYFPHDAGLMKLENDSSLYVSRGTGTWGPPIRFLSPPEITVIELVHEG
jgi:predicted MPP superfamily phosphohydrolase